MHTCIDEIAFYALQFDFHLILLLLFANVLGAFPSSSPVTDDHTTTASVLTTTLRSSELVTTTTTATTTTDRLKASTVPIDNTSQAGLGSVSLIIYLFV